MKKDQKEIFKNLDKKEHPLKALYPVSAIIYDFLEKNGKARILGNKRRSGC